jgi:hypothetical protein
MKFHTFQIVNSRISEWKTSFISCSRRKLRWSR